MTPFLSHLRSFRVAVASTVDKGEPLAPSPEMAMELIHIRTAQQYPMLMLTLLPGNLATRERPYDSLSTLWTVFAHLKPNTSPAIDGETFPAAFQGLTSHAHLIVKSSGSTTVSLHRNTWCNGQPDATQGVLNASHTHYSRRNHFWLITGSCPPMVTTTILCVP